MTVISVLLVVLFILAAIDLIVGVSNDAVNFLNSAIGSKVAPIRTVLIVASLGILMGAVFSEGMMSIARNGIFQPEFFTFDKVFLIFLAVMLTDVILLDVYNTYGLPTSTTVSLIFELLGASCTIGLLMVLDQGKTLSALAEVINFKGALVIISGIFLSVLLSFFFGSLVHFFSRLLFTFRLKKSVQRLGSVFSGLSISIITYFLLIKGVKGTSLISSEQVDWVAENTATILLGSLIIWTIILEILARLLKVNPLKVVVLVGTFALAMAFAGNDLVNFIGVSVAGLAAFEAWTASGIAADAYSMDVLNGKIATPSVILLGAGAIMIITLWTNAKSRKVTETEVSLGRQDEGDERFGSNRFSRFLVGSTLALGRGFARLFPQSLFKTIDERFEKPKRIRHLEGAQASFDLVRASVNLMVSSALIAYGTSQKLPLSTTFVTFMVAMGTSFADRAWGLESAVYRVAGVMQVVGGWLLTALIAFFGCSVIALLLYFTSWYGAFALAVIAFYLLIRSHLVFVRKQKQEVSAEDPFVSFEQVSAKDIVRESKVKASKTIKAIRKLMEQCFALLLKEKSGSIAGIREEIQNLQEASDKLNTRIIKHIRKLDADDQVHTGKAYLIVLDLIQDLVQSSALISESIVQHRDNHHPLPGKSYRETALAIEGRLYIFIEAIERSLE